MVMVATAPRLPRYETCRRSGIALPPLSALALGPRGPLGVIATAPVEVAEVSFEGV